MRLALLLLTMCVALVALSGTSASAAGSGANSAKSLWMPLSGAQMATLGAGHSQQIHATKMKTYALNATGMRNLLKSAPLEFTKASRQHPVIVELPNPQGKMQKFAVSYSPIMQPGLAAKHPNIRTYSGRGITNKTADVRIAMTPLGFNASVRGSTGSWFVDPVYHNSQAVYGSYGAVHLTDTHGNFIEREDKSFDKAQPWMNKVNNGTMNAANLSSGQTLKIYRLALVSDPSFATYWGAKNVTTGKVILMLRADQVYEDEFDYRMDLINNNDKLNLNTPAQAYEPNGPCGAAACYSQSQLASCGSSTLSRNRIVIGQLVGSSNYDIGHISVGQDGGGIAGLGVVGGTNKAEGCTGIPQPDGDYYVVDYLTHEMGHEFGMNHPFNGTQLNCSSGNRNAATSYEPGSGSSIMAYAGICSTDDLQPHSDPYFTAISYQETMAYTSSTLNPLNEAQNISLNHFGGGNEVQTVTFGPGFSTTTSSFQVKIGGTDSATIGAGGVAYTTTNVQNAINAIPGIGGTVVVTGASATGFTVTYSGGGWAGTDVPNLTLDNVSCGGCFNSVDETNHGGANDSFTLHYGANDSVPIVNGSNYTTTGIQAALQGTSEVQQVSLSGYTTNGASYTLDYNGTDSVPIVRGQNNTAAGIAAAIAGGNEQQQATLGSFNGTTQSYQIQWNGNTSVTLGAGGLAINNTDIATAITGISGWPAGGTVTSSGAGNTGFTVTFGGTLANQQVSLVSIVNCTGTCTSSVRENSRGSAGILGLSGATATIGTVADSGYSVTIPGQGNLSQLSVTNPSAGVGGSVSTTTDGTSGLLPAGATATVAAFGGSGTFNNTGFQVTFGGSLAAQQVASLGLTNFTSGASGFVGETVAGGPATGNQGNSTQATGDSAPVMSVPSGPFTIPYQTPFALTGSGTDADGDPVTYMWEQFDRGGTTGTGLVDPHKTNGPLFREFGTALNAAAYDVHQYGYADCSNGENCVNTNPTRVFPDMAQILANNTDAETGDCPGAPAGAAPVAQPLVDCYSEWLPTPAYPGPMHFILTGRDGRGGVSQSALVQVNLGAGTGPFLVTAPNTAVTWEGTSTQNVTWNVAGTNAPPVNTTNVNILLSTDGGTTFPIMLASNVPNNGSASVVVPNIGTHTARIEVQAAGNIYFDVSDSNFTITQDQTISFAPIPDHTWGDPDFTVSATASSGLPVSFTVGATDQCTITGTTVHLTGPGSCSVTAHQAGNGDLINAAPDVTQTFNINKIPQTISFNVDDHTYGDPDFSISATATSGLTVSFSVISGNCTVTDTTVHITGAGNCTVEANQPGDANYAAAPPVDRTFNIHQADQTISFDPIADHTMGDPDFDLDATASSGLAVSYAASGDCTVTGNTVHITGAGSCTITASQPGDSNYNPASDVQQSFDIAVGNQSITFPKPSNKPLGTADFSPASASSGLPISYTSKTTATCTIVSGQIHLVGLGKCTVVAAQPGDADWNPAVSVKKSFKVNPAQTTTSLVATSPVSRGGTITLTATVSSSFGSPTTGDGDVQFFDSHGTLLADVPINAGQAQAFVTAPGTRGTVRFHAQFVPTAGDDYNGSHSATVAVVVQ